jgi:hypothetical protein
MPTDNPKDAERLAGYRDFLERDHGVTAPDVAFFMRLIDRRDAEITRLQQSLAWEKGNNAEAITQINKTLDENRKLQSALADSARLSAERETKESCDAR